MTIHQVRFWDIRKITDTRGGRYRVRWTVASRERCRSFTTKALADAFLTELKKAARDGEPFDPATGLPARQAPEKTAPAVTWYQHATSYAAMKWPDLAPKSRRAVAEALTTITIALTSPAPGPAEADRLRRALFGHAFNAPAADTPAPADVAAILGRAAAASMPVTALEQPAVLRAVLAACAKRLDGTAAAATTTRRKRAVLVNAIGYAIEAGHLTANPVTRIRRGRSAVAETVDRRAVANPCQARALLKAAAARGRRGEHLQAFYACLYYAALRPSEAIALREADCVLPEIGWGRIDLSASAPRAGTAWTDTGAARQRQGLKHRAPGQTRTIPIPPELVAILLAHIARYGTAPDGRLFRTRRGGHVTDSSYLEIWKQARHAALSPEQAATPLARRPYDLRHAAVSLWLNSGVPATEVARRAGHSVAVLLKVYASCLDGQAAPANQRISEALEWTDGELS